MITRWVNRPGDITRRRVTSIATLPFPTTIARSQERSIGRSLSSGRPLYQPTKAVAGRLFARSSPGIPIRRSACAPTAVHFGMTLLIFRQLCCREYSSSFGLSSRTFGGQSRKSISHQQENSQENQQRHAKIYTWADPKLCQITSVKNRLDKKLSLEYSFTIW